MTTIMSATDAGIEVKEVFDVLKPFLGLEVDEEELCMYLAGVILDNGDDLLRDLGPELTPFLHSLEIVDEDDEAAAPALCAKIEAALKSAFAERLRKAQEAPEVDPNAKPAFNFLAATASQHSLLDDLDNWAKFGRGKTGLQQNFNNQLELIDREKVMTRTEMRKARQRKKRAMAVQLVRASVGGLTNMAVPERDYSKGRGQRDILLNDVTIQTPTGETLLDAVPLRIVHGRRYGLIGPNGCGKSTLLAAMANYEIEGFPRDRRVMHVRQESSPEETGASVLACVIAADTELVQLRESIEELNLVLKIDETAIAAVAGEGEAALAAAAEAALKARPELKHFENDISAEDAAAELARAEQRLEEIDAHTAEARASKILYGLRFTEEMVQGPLSNLSGGWRVRAAIAAALFIEPELLMLDEPTNHLDLEAVIWLGQHCREYRHTLLIVSHDRTFLNEVCTDIVRFLTHNKQLAYYKGGFDDYEQQRDERLKEQRRKYEAYVDKRAHMQEFIDKFRYNAKRASLVQSRIKAVEKLDEEAPEKPVEEASFQFSIPSQQMINGAIITMDEVSFSYEYRKGEGVAAESSTDAGDAEEGDKKKNTKALKHEIFRKVNFGVNMNSRIGVVGPNGSGKTTLLQLLLGKLAPMSGSVVSRQTARVAFFSQHHINQLRMDKDSVENMMETFGVKEHKEADFRKHLGGYGIKGDLQLQLCGEMSGGQKSRVAFAMLAFKRPHVVIMDEPTNHLDMECIDGLIGALKNFKGGVVVVSHDQHFIENVCKELWTVGDLTLRRFDGNFKAYAKQVMRELEGRDQRSLAKGR